MISWTLSECCHKKLKGRHGVNYGTLVTGVTSDGPMRPNAHSFDEHIAQREVLFGGASSLASIASGSRGAVHTKLAVPDRGRPDSLGRCSRLPRRRCVAEGSARAPCRTSRRQQNPLSHSDEAQSNGITGRRKVGLQCRLPVDFSKWQLFRVTTIRRKIILS